VGDLAKAKTIDLAVQSLQTDWVSAVCLSEDDVPMEGPSMPIRSLAELCNSEMRVRAVVLADPNMKLRPHDFREVMWAPDPFCIAAWGRPQSLASNLKSELNEKGVNWVDEVEFLSHQVSVDFHFWTGFWPRVDLIREYLDEYLEW
jgi:hypothetical protein